MTVATEEVARRYLNIVANTPIAVPFPLYEEDEVKVVYGINAVTAVLGVDYTITLQPDEFDTFIFTPLTALINKINALITANPSEVNAVTIRSNIGFLTSSTPAAVRNTTFISREFDRGVRRDQELRERVSRAIQLADTFVGNGQTPTLQLKELVPGRLLIVDDTGQFIGMGPDAADIANAQANAVIAANAAAALALAFNTTSFPNNLTVGKNLYLGNDSAVSSLKLGTFGQAIGRSTGSTVFAQEFYNPEGSINNVNVFTILKSGGWRWLTEKGVVAQMDREGQFMANMVISAKEHNIGVTPGTFGTYDNATAASVKANWRGSYGSRAAVMGFTVDQDIATYYSRDSVSLYVENVAKQGFTVLNCNFTTTRVTLGNPMGPTGWMRKGMIIDTLHTPQKYSGFVTAWDTVNGAWVEVSGWYKCIGDNGVGTPDTSAGQVPANGIGIIINPQTKTWGLNLNTFTDGLSQTGQAVAAEVGLFNNKADFSEAAVQTGNNTTSHEGIDVVSLGAYKVGSTFISRSSGINNRAWNGYVASGAEFAGFLDNNARLPEGYEAKWGFLASSGHNNAFGVMDRNQNALGRWDGVDGRLQVGTIGVNQGVNYNGNLISGTRNGLQLTGAASGGASTLESFGVDTDVNLQVLAKGAGYVMLGRNTNKLGFYGNGGTTKPTITGAKGSNAALASLLGALVAMGLVTDSTSA